MSGDDKDLVTDEGVNEGSTDSGTEAANEQTPDIYGVGAVGGAVNGEQQAAPEQILTGKEEAPQPGQRQQVGEG